MISDRSLVRLLRSETIVKRDGTAIRLALTGLVIGLIVGWLLYYTALVRMMVTELHYNDFGKFYYSARLFLDGADMYGPNPATTMPVGAGRSHEFLNMNPPHFHVPLLPLAALSPAGAATIWAVASVVALGFSLFLIVKELRIDITPVRALWGLLALLTFSGTGSVVATGQVSLLLLPFVTVAWCKARRGERTVAGALLGMAISVKPFLLIFVPYFALRRYWAAMIAALLAIASTYALGLLVFGLDAHRDWLRALDATDWTWAAMNASLLGILSRTLAESPYYTPAAELPQLIQPIWRVCALVAGVVTVLAASWDRSRESVDRAFFLLLVGALVVSPLGWVYYLWLPLGAAAALAWNDRRLTAPADSSFSARCRKVLLWLAVPGLVWPLTLILTGQPSAWATVTIGSIYFWTTVCLWGAALIDAWSRRAHGSPAPHHRPSAHDLASRAGRRSRDRPGRWRDERRAESTS